MWTLFLLHKKHPKLWLKPYYLAQHGAERQLGLGVDELAHV